MNVLFFCHDDFACNSMGHIAGFATGLVQRGIFCAVGIPGDDRSSVAALGPDPSFQPTIFSDAWERPAMLFPDGEPADVLIAWTPREHVRSAAQFYRRHFPATRLVVHLEDNEEYLMTRFAAEDFDTLLALPDQALAARLPTHLSHPRMYREFLAEADGVTGIIASLADFVPAGQVFTEIWPGVDFTKFHPAPPSPPLRASLGLGPDEKLLCYPGSSHFANSDEMAALYEAVFLLNRTGHPCRLIRTGHDAPEFLSRFAPADLSRFVIHLGYVERARLPDLLRLADVLVQPGRDDAFNRYRLPSKLPEFFASGRPVLLPHANVGLRVRTREEALLLDRGDGEEIAARCSEIFADDELARRLSAGAAAFARRNFNWDRGARILAEFCANLAC